MKSKPNLRQRTTIGKIDKLDFPELRLSDISCKIDTGADNSAIHCQQVRLVEKNNVKVLRFKLLDPAHPLYDAQDFEITEFKETIIKNTSGIRESRYVIFSKVFLFNKLLDITLTLADREQMTYPVLIGRKFLSKNKLVVDVTRSNISFKKKQQADIICASPFSLVQSIATQPND